MIDTRVINLSYDDVVKAIREYCNRSGKTVPHTATVSVEMAADGKGFGAMVVMPYVEPKRESAAGCARCKDGGDCTNPDCPLFPKEAREVLDDMKKATGMLQAAGLAPKTEGTS